MADLFKKCKTGFAKALDRSFFEDAANVVLALVAVRLARAEATSLKPKNNAH